LEGCFDMTDISNRYRELREVNKLNQKEFAKKIGINQSSLSDIEKGRTKPSVDTIMATCRTFGVQADWILFGEKVVFSNKRLSELINLFGKLSIIDQDDFLNFLRIKVNKN
jgi:transcriptional regulator with XRE-family HTH domain